MTDSFSSSDSAAIERAVEINKSKTFTFDSVWNADRLSDCRQWINKFKPKKVCLQFPDELLLHSARIADELTQDSVATAEAVEFFILGDTSYGSCCVDEVAASHIDADAIVHFGPACLSRITRLPVLYVFPMGDLNTSAFTQAIRNQFPSLADDDVVKNIMIFYSVEYFYHLEKITNAISEWKNIEIGQLALDCEPNVLCWSIANGNVNEDTICLWIGADDQNLFNLQLALKAKSWFIFEQNHQLRPINPHTSAWMRRRYFFIEKCKDARSLGIVVGTLTAKGYLDIVKHIQTLARLRNVRTYLISVGKVNSAKLANFSEIDCFVLIGCTENTLYTSRDFYKPLLSVFEVEMALNPVWQETIPSDYAVDFLAFLPDGRLHRNYDGVNVPDSDVSLVTGRIRNTTINAAPADVLESSERNVVATKNHQLMTTIDSTSSFLSRTWTGLDPTMGQEKPAVMQTGRSGLAIKYSSEFTSSADSK